MEKWKLKDCIGLKSSCRTTASNLLWDLYVINYKWNDSLKEYCTYLYIYIPYPLSLMGLKCAYIKIIYSARRKMKKKYNLEFWYCKVTWEKLGIIIFYGDLLLRLYLDITISFTTGDLHGAWSSHPQSWRLDINILTWHSQLSMGNIF